jgi:two-component system response regulator HydG
MSLPGTVRVLVVDDQVEMAQMVADHLCDLGYEGMATSSGTEALQLLATERIDALVTDLRMPGLDGWSVLQASRTLDPSRPVVLMTAFSAIDSALEATSLGAYHYLTKPFRLDKLVSILEQALRKG